MSEETRPAGHPALSLIDEIARSQGGVVSAAQLSRLGVQREAASRMVRLGLIRRVVRGAYALPASWDPAPPSRRYEMRARGVALRSPSAMVAILSHVSAAAMWRLPLLTVPDVVHVVGPSRATGRRGLVHRHQDRGGAEAVAFGGLLVTALPRTVADCCAILPFTDAVAVADAGLARLTGGDVDRRVDIAGAQEPHREELIELARRTDHAPARAREALLFADGRSGSAAESKARVWMRLLGLPAPQPQFRVDTPYGRYYADLCISEWGVLVEVDGLVKVADPFGGDPVAAVERERRRHIHLQEQGWEIARLTWDDLRSGERVREKILTAAKRARGRGIA